MLIVCQTQLNSEKDVARKFTFLKSILSPIIETYYVTASYLTHLLAGDMPGMRHGLLYILFKLHRLCSQQDIILCNHCIADFFLLQTH